MHVRTFVVVSSAVVGFSSLASAEELAPLEQPGTVMLGFGAIVGRSHVGEKLDDGTTSSYDTTQLQGGLAGEVFVSPVVTLGAAVDVGWTQISHDGGGIGHQLYVAPTARFGLFAPISDHVGFWPYAFGGVIRVDAYPASSLDAWTFGAGARFVLRFDDRWFLVAEPIQVAYSTSSTDLSTGVAFLGPTVRSGLAIGVAL